MQSTRTGWVSFVAFLLILAAMAGLLAAFDRATPGGALPTATPPPTPERRTPSPVVAEPNRRQSVVLVSLGGASTDVLTDWMADGAMPALSQLAERGWMVTALYGVDPPLPQTALSALTTSAASLDAEPIWQTAARHQRTTALLFWPTTDPTVTDQHVDYTLTCAPSNVAAGRQTVVLAQSEPWVGAPPSFSPTYEGTITLPLSIGSANWHVLAVDTLDDGQAAYDAFFLADSTGERGVDDNTPQLALDSWQTLPVFGPAEPSLMLTVAGFRTLTPTAALSPTTSVTPTTTLTPAIAISPTATLIPLLELTLYQIAAQPVVARPAALGQEVIERFGFCPPLPDPRTVASGRLSATAFGELAVRRARWAMRVVAHVYQTRRPHLMVVRQETLLVSEEALLLTDVRQPGYSGARAAAFVEQRRAVANAVDSGLDDLMTAVDLNYATVLVVSEHGVMPVHTQVNVASALQPMWRRLMQRDSHLLASLSLYVEGAFLSVEIQGGTRVQRAALDDAVFRTLAALTDPRTGERIFTRVARREDAASWAETWPYPGGVLAQAAPGYALAATPGVAGGVAETPVYGQAGYDAGLSSMQGVLVAAGRGLSEVEDVRAAHLQDVAAWVTKWLGIQPLANRP
jgi:hypothetical protein